MGICVGYYASIDLFLLFFSSLNWEAFYSSIYNSVV